jgi:lycopene cyclase domain-containing protein
VTYAAFLALFLLPPIVLLALLLRPGRRVLVALGVTALLAVVYTGPWDAAIIAEGVWSYPRGRVLGPTIGGVPLEEYAFFVLQTAMSGLLTALCLAKRPT